VFERFLRRIVSAINAAQQIGTRDLGSASELLDTIRAYDFGQGGLKRKALIEKSKYKLAGELPVAQVVRQALVPIAASSSHL
jgi:hypothetical protein